MPDQDPEIKPSQTEGKVRYGTKFITYVFQQQSFELKCGSETEKEVNSSRNNWKYSWKYTIPVSVHILTFSQSRYAILPRFNHFTQ